MRHLILLTLLTIALSVYGQDTTKTLKTGLDFSSSTTYSGTGSYLPSVTMSKDKHCVFLGPMFVPLYNYSPIALGVQTGYQFYPNGKQRRFNLYFEYDFSFLKNKHSEEIMSNPTSQPYGGLKTYTIRVSTLENNLSFGFRLNFLKLLYFQTNVGKGFGWYSKETDYEFWSGHTNVINYKESWLFQTFFKIGLGFDIPVPKKK